MPMWLSFSYNDSSTTTNTTTLNHSITNNTNKYYLI